MATAKKSATKKSARKKGATKKGTVRPQSQLPPIIIKGGSPINIRYEHHDYPQGGDGNDHTKSSGAEIFEIRVSIPGVVNQVFPVRAGRCLVTFRVG